MLSQPKSQPLQPTRKITSPPGNTLRISTKHLNMTSLQGEMPKEEIYPERVEELTKNMFEEYE